MRLTIAPSISYFYFLSIRSETTKARRDLRKLTCFPFWFSLICQISNVGLSRSIRHVIVILIVIHAPKDQEILRLRRFLPLHIDVGLGSFVGRCSQVVLAIAGHAGISQLYRAFVVIGVVQARRSFVHVRRLHGFLGEGRYGRLPERLQFVHLVALGDGLRRYPTEIIDGICPQNPVVHLIVIGTCERFNGNF